MKLSLPQKVIQKKIAVKIRTIELLSALDMLSLVILVIMQTLKGNADGNAKQTAGTKKHS